jgi:ABC-type phosphate transport system ATPase subunit
MHFEAASAEAPTVAKSDTGSPVLDVRQLTAWYGLRQAIDSITLQISAWWITAITGRVS